MKSILSDDMLITSTRPKPRQILYADALSLLAKDVTKDGLYYVSAPEAPTSIAQYTSSTKTWTGFSGNGGNLPFTPLPEEVVFGPLKFKTGSLERPWPVDGEVFNVLIEVHDEDEEFAAHVLNAPETLQEPMSEACHTLITSELFDMDEVPKTPGIYRAKLKFWTEYHPGYSDCPAEWDWGIRILETIEMVPKN